MGSRPAQSFGARLALVIAALVAITGCTSNHPQRSCAREIWAEPERAGAALSVVGSWDGWLLPGRPLVDAGGGWQRLVIDDLPPGEYGYLILEDGDGGLDRRNPLTTFWREQSDLEVSRLWVEDCAIPAVEVDAVIADDDGHLAVSARFLAAAGGPALDPDQVAATLRAPTSATIERVRADPESGAIEVAIAGLPRGKHTVEITAVDREGAAAAPTIASAWVRPVATAWEGGLLYQVMIDRYRGDQGAALAAPPNPGARAGGTLDGVAASIRDGTFERLGVSALWLSPVYTGPIEAREGRGDGHLYESYHGYWPLESRGVEPRLGGAAALTALIELAHANGIRILLDVVPNHVYEDNPRRLEHPGDGWFNVGDPLCVCGDPGCPWGEFIQTCWFTPYLPDLRVQEPAVMDLGVADAVYWTRTYDLDGLRIDAVPMMPRAATRRIAAGVRESAWPRDDAFLLGEVYTGPGAWGIDVIRYYLGADGLGSVFDFPLMWTIRDVIARRSAGFDVLEDMLLETDDAIAGSGAVLGRFIGNHDTSRFASAIAGDEGGDPWAAPPAQASDPAIYERQGLALGLTLTLPGLAVLYYGDEVGLAGGDDPDSRRVMPADDALTPVQRALRAQTERIGRARRCLPALQRGAQRTLIADADDYVFLRDAGDGAPALVVVNNADDPATLALPAADLADLAGAEALAELVDVVTGARVTLSVDAPTISAAPRSIQVLVPALSPCAGAPS